MIRTRVGYSGGAHPDPTYHDLGDHTETIQMDFDPDRITYKQLLEIFWASHNPCSSGGSVQYQSAIYYHDDRQKEAALETRDLQEARRGKIHTLITAAGRFYRAEDYHQKYYLRQNRDLIREFTSIYPEAKGLTDSTAVARVNGYVGGNGTPEDLDAEMDQLGLSPEGSRRLRAIVGGK